ncbi:hypothetical protein COV24_03540 [candidate division WWE3 bacterium CG10_big_fil_rev_8_21_14_0_10_32_10]|uniref:Glycosyltransferase 2-like domain-containing protein n=1 Tax=candidate division WWE3 bacterium CG10_big_fil_rev_8_21_14_0_10_32_10 TaxID=1975090 RepID=A0A2H0RBW1_UNCKA|nr:MAG: hypothetical protein COV24_03540 [candidate division WWE3 bacterium CG10_big_fil_rev_8_21_14_0_10_32_10]
MLTKKLFIITNEERSRMSLNAMKSIVPHTKETELRVFLNCKIDFNPLIDYAMFFQNIDKRIKINCEDKKFGLSMAWNHCCEQTKEDVCILLNDDVVLNDENWETNLDELLEKNKRHKVFLLCAPNGFSGFAIRKSFWELIGGFTPFPSGYYEDDDFFLRVMKLYGLHHKKEIMDEVFFSLYDRGIKPMFAHVPNPCAKKWDKSINSRLFHSMWKETKTSTSTSFENKNGINYEWIGK